MVTTTLVPASRAASTAPRMQLLGPWAVQAADEQVDHAEPRREHDLVAVAAQQPAIRSRVPGATSVRPLSTLDTVETETPASAAMPVSVLRPGSRAITHSFRKIYAPTHPDDDVDRAATVLPRR